VASAAIAAGVAALVAGLRHFHANQAIAAVLALRSFMSAVPFSDFTRRWTKASEVARQVSAEPMKTS
jgi:hypothetical protein